jgi:rubrerythrin
MSVQQSPLAQPHIDRYLGHSKALDLTGIDFNDVPNHPLRSDEIQALTYFMDVESNTIVYLKELLSTPAIEVPEIQAFLSCWAYEEFFHGAALKQFLRSAGVPVDEDRTANVAKTKGIVHHLRTIAQTLLAKWAGKRFIGVHMTWGAVNELTTAEGYLRLIAKTDHPILKELLTRIMKDERRHYAFYFREAQERLADPKTAWLTSTLIRRFFEPVGADIRSLDEVDAVTLYVLGDEEGQEVVRSIDKRIGTLPGLEGFRGVEKCLERTRARYGKTLGHHGQMPVPAAT